MIRLKDLLTESSFVFERAYYKDLRTIATAIKQKLLSNQKSLLKNSTSIDFIDALNSLLNRFGVFVEMEAYEPNLIYPETGIVNGFIDSAANIYIGLTDDIIDRVDEDNFDSFANNIHSVILHELNHVHQFTSAKGRFKPVDSLDSRYLENIHEIQSHAIEAMDNYLSLGYNQLQIKKMLKAPSLQSTPSPTESDAFWKYYDYFYEQGNQGSTWKGFLKYCVEYLDSID